MKKIVCLDMSIEQVHMIESSIVFKIINVEKDIELLKKVNTILENQNTKKTLAEMQERLKDYHNLLNEIRRSYQWMSK